MELIPVDEKREIVIAETKKDASLFLSIRFAHFARISILEHNFFTCAIPGGSSPTDFFETITTSSIGEHIEWDKVKIFFTDERAVPFDHKESNYGAAAPYFTKEPFNKVQFFPMHAYKEDLAKECKEYEKVIQKECCNGLLDLVILGIGADGHTASLFPFSTVLHNESCLTAPAVNPHTGSKRMTLTFKAINESKKIAALAFGKEKAEMIHQVFSQNEDEDKYPAKTLGKGNSSVIFILDQKASKSLANAHPQHNEE